MKYLLKKSSLIVLTISLVLFGLISCESNDDANSEESKETPVENATKAKLVGEWRLISSKVDGELIAESDFATLKESYANFNEDNTYKVFYKKSSGASTSTSTYSGTYVVNQLNSVTFYGSDSEIALVDNTLQITSKNAANKTQVDLFIRSDNDEFEEEDADETDVVDKEEDSTDTNNSYDGTDVIAKLKGVWTISGVDDDCLKKNTLNFESDDLLVFSQHKKTFNRSDLTRNNINVSYPMPAIFSASVTKGVSTVTFNTEADCQFIKVSKLHYNVLDAQTIAINETSTLIIKLLNDTTINLIYTYKDSDSNEQVIEFDYKKM
ncbi:lipocalin family protein [Polaribacter sp. Q13]|uniref:lipocalin family protein n=1 Tax=Polaribacter sp. Q13 TaxID=2806551 RepID=UPI00193BE55E|nr:lipocalin family protein [Polaribacter sp. Q13]QVY65464.1 lipocalin family protein [Polaribacter sp. Q13]